VRSGVVLLGRVGQKLVLGIYEQAWFKIQTCATY
jgi:hypothetical protein